MRPLALTLDPWECFENSGILPKIGKNRRKSQFRYLEKGVLELHRAAKTKLWQIKQSSFFRPDHNGQTWINRLVSGPPDDRFWRKRNFPTEDDYVFESFLLHVTHRSYPSRRRACFLFMASLSHVVERNCQEITWSVLYQIRIYRKLANLTFLLSNSRLSPKD